MNIQDNYDIIIEGGQSNAQGSGTGPVDAFEEFKPSSDILYLTPDCKVTVDDKGVHVEYPSDDLEIKIAKERVVDGNAYGDLALTFANDYIKNGMLINLDYIYSTLINSDGKDPLDFEAVKNSPKSYNCVATVAKTAEPRFEKIEGKG